MSETSFTISTIIISYNTASLTLKAIQSTLDNYQEDKIVGEVIVIDNHSTDDSVSQIKKQFGKKISLIENKTNSGFAKANNQGMKLAKGKYFFLLNSDTELHSLAIKNLLSVFEKYPDEMITAELANTRDMIDRVGMVSGQILNPDGSIQPQGGSLPTLLNMMAWWLWPFPGTAPIPVDQHYHIESLDFFQKQQKMEWLAGTALLLRKDMINEIGMLDEDIFMYAEDVELCLRAKNHHWDCVYTPDAKITHYGSASSNPDESLFREISGLDYVTAKHWSFWQYQFLRLVFILGSALRWLLFGIIQNNEKKQALYARIFNFALTKTD